MYYICYGKLAREVYLRLCVYGRAFKEEGEEEGGGGIGIEVGIRAIGYGIMRMYVGTRVDFNLLFWRVGDPTMRHVYKKRF